MNEKTDQFANPVINENGMVEVPLSRATRKRMDALRLPGESDNDLVKRIIGPPRGMTAGAAMPLPTDLEARDTTTLLGIQSGSLRPVAMDEKVKLSKDPNHPSKFMVIKKELVEKLSDMEPTDVAGCLQQRPDEALINLTDTALGGDIAAAMYGVSASNKKARLLDLKSTVAANRPLTDSFYHLLDVRQHKTESERALWQAQCNAAVAFLAKIAVAPVLQKVGESGFHNCVEAWRAGQIFVPRRSDVMPDDVKRAIGANPTIFVVQHDWAGAFAKAQDFADGEFRIPYDEAVYEFRISGARVIASISTDDDLPRTMMLNVKTPYGWLLADCSRWENGVWNRIGAFADDKVAAPLIDLCARQIRAIAIALDAEVAETELVRAPYKLNAQRERKGRLPLFDFHIIDLSHRKRYAALPSAADHETARRRLHFVRGHWRHYVTHKTWIHWFLRGDPDLGFIDKEYRL